jgi:MFS family permease
MSLRSAQFLKDAENEPLQYNGGPGWQEVSTGLKLVARGYCLLIVGSIVVSLLIWIALTRPPTPGVSEDRDDRNLLLSAAALLCVFTVVCSYSLVLAGQWRCLMHAPERNSAKEVMYVCFICLLIGSGLNVAGAYLDGGKTYAALQRGWVGLEKIDPWSAGNLMLIGSALLGLAGSMVFSQFLRGVADCFNDRRRARAVDFNLWFMGLLIGGSLGTHFLVQRLSLKANALPWLIGGWLFCFAWHLWLVTRMQRCVDEGMRRHGVLCDVQPVSGGAGAISVHTLSGLRRLAKNGIGRE